MPSWRLPVPWKSSSWRPLAPPNWTTTWFSTIPTVSDILQIPCIFAAASATALLSAISFHLLHLFFQRNRMPTLFIVKCCIAANRRRTWGTRFSIYLFLSPRSFLFDFCFLFVRRRPPESLLFIFFFSFSALSSHPQGFTPTRTQRKGTRVVWPALRSPKICSFTRTHDSAR